MLNDGFILGSILTTFLLQTVWRLWSHRKWKIEKKRNKSCEIVGDKSNKESLLSANGKTLEFFFFYG